jgi:CRP/FNR family cyclic AMP-dependent transcriptional regulator
VAPGWRFLKESRGNSTSLPHQDLGRSRTTGTAHGAEEDAMRRTTEVEERLARVPLFAGLSRRQLRLVGSLVTHLDQPTGRVLTREGKRGHEFMVVLDGEVEIYREGDLVGTAGPGSYVGEIALLHNRPRTATAIAKTPATIAVANPREFRALLQVTPGLASQIRATAAQRLAASQTELAPG